jgi:hypothetical protein
LVRLGLLSRRRYVNSAFLIAGDAQPVMGAEFEDELDFVSEVFGVGMSPPE